MKLSAEQQKMKERIDYLKNYINTYDKQIGYLDYSDKTFIDDVLYGLGVAVDDKFKLANGFNDFKEFLRNYLKEPKP